MAPLYTSPDIAAKRTLRDAMIALRAGLDPSLGNDLAAHLLASGIIPPASVVSGFWPLVGEIDIRPALHAVVEHGHTVGLPMTPARGQALTFRRWMPGAVLRPGRFGTQEPDGPLVVPNVLLIPMLAFDRRGARLGYGGGYYDRTIAALNGRFLAIGCAFAAQEVDSVPTEPHDRFMHAIATDAGMVFVE